MHIGERLFGGYDTHLQENVKSENVKGTEQISQTQPSADISALREGAVFNGEILDIVGEKVTIALENQANLSARLQGDVSLGVGDQLLFAVKENNASQILIKPLFDSLYSAQTQVLEKALDAAGLSPTEKNFTAAKELMEAGMPVDKAGLVRILSQSMKYPEASMQTLVSLNKMNIPVTEANIAQYERYQSYSHQLSGDIGQAADSMASFAEAFPAGTQASVLLSTAGEILDMFMQDIPAPNAEGEMTGEAAAAGNENIGGQAVENTDISGQAVENEDIGEQAAGKTETVASEENSNEQAAKLTADTGEKAVGEEIQNADRQSVKISAQETAGQPEGTVVKPAGRQTDAAAIDNEQGLKTSEQKETVGNQQLAGFAEKAGLSREEAANLTNILQKAGLSREDIADIQRQADSPEQILKDITQALAGANAGDAAVRELLQSGEFKKMFSDMVKKSWALNPKEMKDPKEIDDLYDRIMKQSKGFEDAVAAKGGDAKGFHQNFQNMRQNMQFMEQLNNQMIYAQMPLKLSNQNANSELYVYADKRKLMEKKDGISVMLHLDMDHLGMTDIKVTLTGSNVNARFYLNDQQSVDIVANNMGQLAKQLADRGFSLTNEVVKRQAQESINKVIDEIVDENAERSIKRYTFDART